MQGQVPKSRNAQVAVLSFEGQCWCQFVVGLLFLFVRFAIKVFIINL